MFTGIVEDTGRLVASQVASGQEQGLAEGDANMELRLSSALAARGAKLGDSIAVDGVCLTVTDLPGDDTFAVDVMPETLRHTSLGSLKVGSRVNIERAMPAGGRLDGHIVQGHVDGVGSLVKRVDGEKWVDLTFHIPTDLAKYVASKGSIAVSGTSLTVTHAGPDSFGVSLIPTTLEHTTLGELRVGDRVNLEVDIIAKYVERLTSGSAVPVAQVISEPISSEPIISPDLDDSQLKEATLAALAAGRPVLVADDLSRENEVDVILAAELVTPQWLAWTIRYTSGYVCAPMPAALADSLDLPLMVPNSQDPFTTAYTVSVDAAQGVTTGISAHDRATTLRALANATAQPQDLIRPGHVLPLRAVPGGLSVRRGHTEATVALCELAGLHPVGVIAELTHDDGTMMRLHDSYAFAAEHGLVVVTIDQIADWVAADALQNADLLPSVVGPIVESTRVRRSATAQLPTAHGEFTMHTYSDLVTGAEHAVLESDQPGSLVRVHSECLTGDVFGSARCDCGSQLDQSIELVAKQGGAVIYLRGHEGRGIGLRAKVQAYALQDQGRDTVDANLDLGLPADAREYGAAAAILQDLFSHNPLLSQSLTLLTNNPAKTEGLALHGVYVQNTQHIAVGQTEHNLDYLRTKAERMGHVYSGGTK